MCYNIKKVLKGENMNIEMLKKIIEEEKDKGKTKTELYHILQEKGMSFEVARDIVNKLYNSDTCEVRNEPEKVKKNKLKCELPKFKYSFNFNTKIILLLSVLFLSILLGIFFGNLNIGTDIYAVIISIFIATFILFITKGDRMLKFQLYSVFLTVFSILISKYIIFYNESLKMLSDSRNIADINSFRAMGAYYQETRDLIISDGLYSLLNFNLVWILISIAIAFEFSHGDYKKIKELVIKNPTK